MFEGVFGRDNTTVRSRTEAQKLLQHLVDQSIDVNTRRVEQANPGVFLIAQHQMQLRSTEDD